MRLYLSSQHLGNPCDMLYELVGENKQVAVIANAIDDKPKDFRKDRVQREIIMLGQIGLSAEDLDLRNYFGDPSELDYYIRTKSLVWVRGGNTFILRRAMLESGFDEVVLPKIFNNQVVYGGYSAALIVASKDLSGAEIVDEPNTIPAGYPDVAAPFSGLGLIDFHLIPHSGSREPWADKVPDHVNYLINDNRHVETLRDGEVYIIDKDKKGIIS